MSPTLASIRRRSAREKRIEDAMRAAIYIIKTSKASTIHDIRNVVADCFDLSLSEMTCRYRYSNRMEHIVARQFAMAAAREITARSSSFVGDVFGCDRTNVHHAYRKYKTKVRALLGDDYSIPPKPASKRKKDLTWDFQESICRTIEEAQLRTMSSLAALIKWSVDDNYTHSTDIFPTLSSWRAANQFRVLLRLGYAEWMTFEGCNDDKWWRVTDEGRHAYERLVFVHELRRELGLLGGAVRSPAMGVPDRRDGMAVREILEMEAVLTLE